MHMANLEMCTGGQENFHGKERVCVSSLRFLLARIGVPSISAALTRLQHGLERFRVGQAVVLSDDIHPGSGKPLFLTSSSLSLNGITSSAGECRITVPGFHKMSSR